MNAADQATWPFTVSPLPFAEQALAPVISPQTLYFHHGKHHRGYVEKLNSLVKQRDLQNLSLVELIRCTYGVPEYSEIFDNAAQVFNHGFYWQSLSPVRHPSIDAKPRGELAQQIHEQFGNVSALKAQMVQAAVAQFGSGWVWLVAEDGKLRVMRTANAEVPITDARLPLLTLDVWEHAYYLDYQNRREEHVAAVVNRLLNWTFAADNLALGELAYEP
jgi:Fe-Mn family superoxide dismutase